MTGRTPEQVDLFRKYYQAQGMWGMPTVGQIDYTDVLSVNLADVVPCAAGPKRPQDRIPLSEMKHAFGELMRKPKADGGYGVATWVAPMTSPRNTNPHTELEMIQNRPTPDRVTGTERPAGDLGHGDVVIAAITSCTNTSNPSVMLGAGLVAKKAVERGLKVPPFVKTSLAPGSRVVSDYLAKTGLQKPLDALGFQVVGYGCTTCIGNSGPLPPAIEDAIKGKDLVVASVLSGNRNFEARVHQSVRANYLMSPPLVVAYAIAGTVDIDMDHEPLGKDQAGKPVFLKDIWPTPAEIEQALATANDAESYRRNYKDVQSLNPMWGKIPTSGGVLYQWDPKSDYVRNPPYFDGVQDQPPPPQAIANARALAIFGESITTDHISPAGAIKGDSPAGKYLAGLGIKKEDFNTYGARRGNHEVMVRGTFANVRIKNQMMGGQEGGLTKHQPSGEAMAIYDAAERYRKENVPLVIFAGTEYGTGSSRDWAAKGTRLLGVRAVIAQSFERIHRSNLVGMGVLPCQFEDGITAASLNLDGTEAFDIVGTDKEVTSDSRIFLRVKRKSGETFEVPLRARIDTAIEAEYYRHGGILPYMLRQLLAR
jgi:aconitate hydratase